MASATKAGHTTQLRTTATVVERGAGPGLLDDQSGDREQGGEQQRRFQPPLQGKGSRAHGTVFDDLALATSVILQASPAAGEGESLGLPAA